jgi:hypothetical protein
MDCEQIPEKADLCPQDGENRHAQVVIRQAERELRQLIEERAKVTKRIGSLKHTIAGLVELFGDSILDTAVLSLLDRKGRFRQPGITPACRTILMEAGRPMSARDVRDEIQRTTPGLLAHHKDPMPTIYTILKRLVDYGEATGLPRGRGRRSWLWAAERKSRPIAPDQPGSRPPRSGRLAISPRLPTLDATELKPSRPAPADPNAALTF